MGLKNRKLFRSMCESRGLWASSTDRDTMAVRRYMSWKILVEIPYSKFNCPDWEELEELLEWCVLESTFL